MFEGTKFIYSFREYQKRVLDDMDLYIRDGNLHIVAPPGSGKTVLGLEIARRLGNPTIVFSPTRAIRDQWIDRYVKLFFSEGTSLADINYLSTDIKNISFLTSTTYQALNSIFSDKFNEDEQTIEADEEEDIIKEKNIKISLTEQEQKISEFITKLNGMGIKTLILDEAHHLRSEWWKALIKIKDEIKDLKIIALTATPPYDSEKSEWDKYIQLCGKIDLEIYVAELVKNGDLCPHQDYLVLNSITRIEKDQMERMENDIKEYVKILAQDKTFINSLITNPCIQKANENIEKILEKPSYYSSIVLFLGNIGYKTEVENAAKIIGINKNEIKFNTSLLGAMLQEYLFKDELSKDLNHTEEIIANFKKIGVIDNKTINITSPKKIESILRQSVGKYESILKIVLNESKNLGNNLRMLILTDNIRKNVLLNDNVDALSLGKLGVIPIFEHLRNNQTYGQKLAVLTGTIKIIHKGSIEMFKDIAKTEGIEEIVFEELKKDCNYVQIIVSETLSKKIVTIVTRLFERGGTNILIGTSSLLGEGWDAPCINSLILASTVSSYMLSNQMRGRAIRSYKEDINKVSNIWHLVSLPIKDISISAIKDNIYDNFFGEQIINYYYDISKFEKKVEHIVGLNVQDEIIENGIDRFEVIDLKLGLPDTKTRVEKYNEKTFINSKNRELIKQAWKNAIDCAKDADMQEIVDLKNEEKVQVFTYTDVAGYFTQIFIYILGIMGLLILDNRGNLLWLILHDGVAALIAFVSVIILLLKPGFNIIKIFIFAGNPKWIVKRVGRVVLNTLCYKGVIKTDAEEIVIKVEKLYNGSVSCFIKNGTTYEKNVFAGTMKELFDPIDNPRYILQKENNLLGNMLKQVDYYSVPNIIGDNKKYVSYFYKEWIEHVSNAKLIYTRSVDGRRLLLKIRIKAVSGIEKNRRKKAWE